MQKQATLLLLLNLIIVNCLHDDFCCDHVTLPGASDQKTTVAFKDGSFFDGMFADVLNTSVSVFTSTVMGANLPQNYIGDVGKMVINASVNYMAGTSSSLLLDTINGDKPDLNKVLINGAEQGVIAGVLSISPENITGGVSPKGQGLSAFAEGLQQFWSDGRFSKSEQNAKKKN